MIKPLYIDPLGLSCTPSAATPCGPCVCDTPTLMKDPKWVYKQRTKTRRDNGKKVEYVDMCMEWVAVVNTTGNCGCRLAFQFFSPKILAKFTATSRSYFWINSFAASSINFIKLFYFMRLFSIPCLFSTFDVTSRTGLLLQ